MLYKLLDQHAWQNHNEMPRDQPPQPTTPSGSCRMPPSIPCAVPSLERCRRPMSPILGRPDGDPVKTMGVISNPRFLSDIDDVGLSSTARPDSDRDAELLDAYSHAVTNVVAHVSPAVIALRQRRGQAMSAGSGVI